MAKRKNPAYSKADLAKWRADMQKLQPGPSDADLMLNSNTIVSMTLGETDTGMLAVLRNDRNEVHRLFLNPVVAHALWVGILTCGKTGNWMHPHGEVILPTLPKG